MIKTAMQLKAKCRNLAYGSEKAAKAYARTYFMERFLERVSMSEYRNQFILKGGFLVTAMIGIDLRSTMDIDTTVKTIPLTRQNIEKILSDILNIDIDDAVNFQITKTERIMEDFDYPGIRVHIEGHLEKLRQVIKVDISTDDVITPCAVDFEYKLLFETRSINLLAYNTETLMAEKMQTILSREMANTRMRDFYDIYEITSRVPYDADCLFRAFEATCNKRGTMLLDKKILKTVESLAADINMQDSWRTYISKADYADDIDWEDIMNVVESVTQLLYSRKTNLSEWK